jgi:hypothetical protein
MQAKMLTPERCWLFHRWHVVHDTGYTVYSECTDCKSRKVTQPPNGYQPIDTDWLAGLRHNSELTAELTTGD